MEDSVVIESDLLNSSDIEEVTVVEELRVASGESDGDVVRENDRSSDKLPVTLSESDAETVSVADPSSLCVIVKLLVSDLLFSIVADPEIVTLIETDADLDFDDSSELVTDVVSGDEEVRDIDEEASRLKVTDIVVLALFDTESNDVGLIDRDGSSVAEPDGLPDIVSESSLDSSCVRDAEFGLAVIVVSELGEEELVIVKDVVLVRRLASTEQAKSTRDMTILTMYNEDLIHGQCSMNL